MHPGPLAHSHGYILLADISPFNPSLNRLIEEREIRCIIILRCFGPLREFCTAEIWYAIFLRCFGPLCGFWRAELWCAMFLRCFGPLCGLCRTEIRCATFLRCFGPLCGFWRGKLRCATFLRRFRPLCGFCRAIRGDRPAANAPFSEWSWERKWVQEPVSNWERRRISLQGAVRRYETD